MFLNAGNTPPKPWILNEMVLEGAASACTPRSPTENLLSRAIYHHPGLPGNPPFSTRKVHLTHEVLDKHCGSRLAFSNETQINWKNSKPRLLRSLEVTREAVKKVSLSCTQHLHVFGLN